jgi:transcriptional regulator NrdR family protein
MSTCLRCKGETRVVDSRPTLTTDLRRRRVCLDCGYRFTTLEIPVTPHPRSKEIAQWAAEEARRIFLDEGQPDVRQSAVG